MTQEQIKAKAKEYFPNDEFKQQIVIDAINWATEELQKENAELRAKESFVGDQNRKLCEQQQKIEVLEAENAELATRCNELFLQTMQLTKAKELLKWFVWYFREGSPNLVPYKHKVEEAEQFINSEGK